MTESICQCSTALLVPGSAFQFVLSVALSAGGRDFSKDYHHVKSYRGHSDMTDSLCQTQYERIMSHNTCLGWGTNPLCGKQETPSAFCNKDTMPSLIPAWLFTLSGHICQQCHQDIALCISCFDCCLTNCSGVTLSAGTYSVVMGTLVPGK